MCQAQPTVKDAEDQTDPTLTGVASMEDIFALNEKMTARMPKKKLKAKHQDEQQQPALGLGSRSPQKTTIKEKKSKGSIKRSAARASMKGRIMTDDRGIIREMDSQNSGSSLNSPRNPPKRRLKRGNTSVASIN